MNCKHENVILKAEDIPYGQVVYLYGADNRQDDQDYLMWTNGETCWYTYAWSNVRRTLESALWENGAWIERLRWKVSLDIPEKYHPRLVEFPPSVIAKTKAYSVR